MADQARWFKLWCSAPGDDTLQNLSPADRWAWAAFGAYTKLHGTRGVIVVSPTNAVLAAEMGVTLASLKCVITSLPHVSVEEGENRHGAFTVTWHNWVRYQEDSTQAERQRASRIKRRREEIRRDETRRDKKATATTLSGSPPDGASLNGSSLTYARQILDFLNHKAGRNYQATPVNLDFIRARLTEGATVDQCRAIIGRKTAAWKGDEKMAAFLRPATLFNRTKFAQYLGELPATAFKPETAP